MAKKDLRQMKKDKLNKNDIKTAADKAGVNVNTEGIGDVTGLEDAIKQYENKDEDELMGELSDIITKGKQDGSFSNEMLDEFINNVSPMMDKQQRDKLKSITAMLKQKK